MRKKVASDFGPSELKALPRSYFKSVILILSKRLKKPDPPMHCEPRLGSILNRGTKIQSGRITIAKHHSDSLIAIVFANVGTQRNGNWATS